jgi:flagellar protein FliS
MNARHAYLEGRILSADPLELVRILYEEALDAVISARAHLGAGDIAARSRQITRAQLILLELESSLDHQRGGELSANLSKLYDYMSARLTSANLEQREEPLCEVERLLMTLLEGWRGCRPPAETPALPESAPPPAYRPALESEPALAGSSWLY